MLDITDYVDEDERMKTKDSPITTLATVSRGYATDDQCAAAMNREKELLSGLSAAYEAMMTMRAMLAKNADISLAGGPLEATIQATAVMLYPPTKGKA